jgi:hypothetical protein
VAGEDLVSGVLASVEGALLGEVLFSAGEALVAGVLFWVGLEAGVALGLGVTALATAARIKLADNTVSVFVIFMGRFLSWGWESAIIVAVRFRLSGPKKSFKTLFALNYSSCGFAECLHARGVGFAE